LLYILFIVCNSINENDEHHHDVNITVMRGVFDVGGGVLGVAGIRSSKHLPYIVFISKIMIFVFPRVLQNSSSHQKFLRTKDFTGTKIRLKETPRTVKKISLNLRIKRESFKRN